MQIESPKELISIHKKLIAALHALNDSKNLTQLIDELKSRRESSSLEFYDILIFLLYICHEETVLNHPANDKLRKLAQECYSHSEPLELLAELEKKGNASVKILFDRFVYSATAENEKPTPKRRGDRRSP